MTVIKALILGVVSGITDFLPVSTSGHLSLVSHIMGVSTEIDLSLLIYIHIGTLISIFLVYYSQIFRCFSEFIGIFSDAAANLSQLFGGKRGEKTYRKIVTTHYRKMSLMILIALIPTIIFGIISAGLSESLIGNLLASGIGLLITALLLLVASFSTHLYKKPHEAKYFDAVLVGAFQGFSGFPGISRLGMTISSGFLSGFTAKFTLLFSFVLAIPSVLGAFFFELIRTKSAVPAIGMGYTVIAMFSAAIVGYFILSLLKKFLLPHYTRVFALYCLVIGAVSIIIYLV